MAFNIMVVDDSRVIRNVIKKALQLAEVPVNMLHEASNGKEALEILEQEWVDLILADINMPIMNGVEMIERMHENGLMKTIPVIIVSTEGSQRRIEELKAKGVRAYIRKPFTPELIRELVFDIMGVKE